MNNWKNIYIYIYIEYVYIYIYQKVGAPCTYLLFSWSNWRACLRTWCDPRTRVPQWRFDKFDKNLGWIDSTVSTKHYTWSLYSIPVVAIREDRLVILVNLPSLASISYIYIYISSASALDKHQNGPNLSLNCRSECPPRIQNPNIRCAAIRTLFGAKGPAAVESSASCSCHEATNTIQSRRPNPIVWSNQPNQPHQDLSFPISRLLVGGKAHVKGTLVVELLFRAAWTGCKMKEANATGTAMNGFNFKHTQTNVFTLR